MRDDQGEPRNTGLRQWLCPVEYDPRLRWVVSRPRDYSTGLQRVWNNHPRAYAQGLLWYGVKGTG